MNKIIIILANAPINNGNCGCVALSLSVLKLLDDIFKNKGQKYEVYLLDSKIAGNDVCDYNVSTFHTCFRNSQYLPYNFLTFVKGLLFPHNTIRSFNIFRKADYILDIGQGDSFADIYGDWRFRNIDRIHKQARLFSKPYCLLPQTIGPFTDERKKRKAIKSINSATLVMARDRQSLNYVKEIAPKQKNVEEYIDVAFFLPYKKIDFSSDFTHVGLNISALLWNGGYKRDNQFGLADNYQRVVASIIDYFLSKPDVCLHLIPHVVQGKRHIENDYEVCYDLWNNYNNPRLVLAPYAFGPIEIKSYIAGMDFFIGARMHATIAAFSSGVPVVPMAYSRKFNGLFIDTLHYDYIADMKELNEESIMNIIKNAFHDRNRLGKLIGRQMQEVVKDRKEKLINDLSNLLKL